jgi:predicted membrane protein
MLAGDHVRVPRGPKRFYNGLILRVAPTSTGSRTRYYVLISLKDRGVIRRLRARKVLPLEP